MAETFHPKKFRLGEQLVSDGLIKSDVLQDCLEKARAQGLKIGEYLIREGLVSEENIANAICRHSGTIRYDQDKFPVSKDLESVISMRDAQLYKAVPIMVRDSILYVGMLDPLNTQLIDTLEEMTAMDIEPVFCLSREFLDLYSAMYGKYTGLKGAAMTLQEKADKEDSSSSLELVNTKEEEDISDTGSPNEAPVIRMVNAVIAQGVREGASDIHINPRKENIDVRFRIDGLLRNVSSVAPKVGPSLASRIKVLAGMDISITRIPQDGRFTVLVDGREINIRVSSLPTIHGENIVMRLLDMSSNKIHTLAQLGMSDRDQELLERCIRRPYGMILSTGPTGSGKSTSLYSILQMINRPDINTITLEDPVEYRMDGVRQVQLNARAGMTFASGLRSILRQDPDIIMVGEIRDAETARIAVQAALTGHLVLSTLHANDSTGAVSRLIDMGVEPFLVASVLLAAFAQRLVRRVCPYCGEEYEPPARMLRHAGIAEHAGPFLHGRGCPRCGGTGYSGRTAIFEIMPMSEEIQEAISGHRSMQEIRRLAIANGMHSLIEDARDKVLAGHTTVEEALRVAMV